MICGNTADELFDNILAEMQVNNDDDNIAFEIINANLCLTDPTRNTMCNCHRKMPIRYAIAEFIWYISTNTTWKAIYPYSKFWKEISDDGININSNYGHCIRKKFGFDQWEHCKKLLLKNKNSRQAIIHIKEARNLIKHPTKDLNCTICLQFLIRNNKLDMITTMRSNDLWLGLPYDLFSFTCLQMLMAMELNVDVGKYYHNAGSLHLYKRDYDKLVNKEVTK